MLVIGVDIGYHNTNKTENNKDLMPKLLTNYVTSPKYISSILSSCVLDIWNKKAVRKQLPWERRHVVYTDYGVHYMETGQFWRAQAENIPRIRANSRLHYRSHGNSRRYATASWSPRNIDNKDAFGDKMAKSKMKISLLSKDPWVDWVDRIIMSMFRIINQPLRSKIEDRLNALLLGLI